MTSYTRSWPAATEAAEALAEREEHESSGVHLDRLAEARLFAWDAYRQVEMMYVELDGIADDHGLFPPKIQSELRHIQTRLASLRDWIERFGSALDEAVESARDGAGSDAAGAEKP